MKRLLIAIVAALLLAPVSSGAQLFGQFTTAAVSTELEGCAFTAIGDDVLRAGAAIRFQINQRCDMGIQAGFDRFRGTNSAGAGVDFKLYLLNPDSPIPVDIAIDAHLGHLRSSNYNRNIFGIGVIASGILEVSSSMMIEPFASLILRSTYFSKKTAGGDQPEGWPAADDDWSSVTDTMLRGGAMIGLTDEYQVAVEMELDSEFSVGAAFNVIF